jgi:transcriptional regulator with XRE-family HTH domain
LCRTKNQERSEKGKKGRAKMNKLQEKRKAKGLSQSQLAEASGVNIRTLQHYESGHRDISIASARTVLKLAKALDTTVEELIRKDD